MSTSFKIVEKFKHYFNEDRCTEGLATVKSLRDLISNCSAVTITEYDSILNSAVTELSQSEYAFAPIKSASELFMRYITFCKLDNDFDDSKSSLLKKADLFITKISQNIDIIANLCQYFLKDIKNIFIMSGSKLVWETLVMYIRQNQRKEINIYVLGAPVVMYMNTMSNLSNYVSFIEIDHNSVVHYLRDIQIVLSGAEAVVGNGGILNELGTLNIAILAKAMSVPFYVMTESFRLTRFFPLDQDDIPDEFKYQPSDRCLPNRDLKVIPRIDYTPPEYIKMIVTDIGYISPMNVSEECFKLYL